MTSHLNDSSSPVRAFLAERFGDAKAARKVLQLSGDPGVVSAAAELGGQKAWTMPAPQVLPVPSHDRAFPYREVGTALDYRIRFMFQAVPVETLVAHHGAQRLGELFDTDSPPKAFDALSDKVTKALRNEPPLRGTVDFEEDLATYCYALALYEQCFRGLVDKSWPLARLGKKASLDKVLAMVPEEAKRDLVSLAELFSATQGSMLRAKHFLPNPTFDHSLELGGADADWIVDHCLVDMKTTIQPTIERIALWQLIGYALSDASDWYGIERVGLYFSRHGYLVSWGLEELLSLLAGKATKVGAVRKEWSKLMRQL